MPPMWAWKRSTRSIDWRRSFASKLKPPFPRPPPGRSRTGAARVFDRVRELVGVPAVLRVAAVRVDRAEQVVGGRVGDFVVERVAGEGRVVRLDVDLVLGFEPVAAEKTVDDGDVVVVLMLRRLHRLRLDQQRPVEADAVLLFDHQVKEAGELLAFAAQVGVEQRVVAFTAAQRT